MLIVNGAMRLPAEEGPTRKYTFSRDQAATAKHGDNGKPLLCVSTVLYELHNA